MNQSNPADRRKHTRFSATAFLNRPVHLAPLPPYFGHAIKGRLIDLSAGGLSVLMGEFLPPQTFFSLCIVLPDHTRIDTTIKIIHALPRGKNYLHGIEFLTLPTEMGERIERMSSDFMNCENRIQAHEAEVCHTDCAFFNMCDKKQKIDVVMDTNSAIELAFRQIEKPKSNSPISV